MNQPYSALEKCQSHPTYLIIPFCIFQFKIKNPSVFRKHFKKALIEVEEVRLLSPHACRHTYVSQLQAVGVELETIRTLSGHADIEMTTNYLHIQQQVRIDAAGKLNSLLSIAS